MKPSNCYYHTEDDGCSKSFISCPQIVDGICDMGCGGAGWEDLNEGIKRDLKEIIKLNKEKEKKNENNKKRDIRNK